MSTDVEFDEYDEEAFQIISQVLETYARPSKRRRVSSSTNTPDDEDIIDSEPELPSSRNASNRSKRGSLSLDEDDSVHEAGDKAREKAAKEPKKKKPKHLIHIPKVHRQYKETFQYGTQAADGEPGSSPCMARGARWKLPNPQHRETDNQQTKSLAQKSGTTLEAFFKPLALKEVDSNRTITNRRPANSISAEQNSTAISLYDNDEEDDESTNIPSLRDNPSARTNSSSGKANSAPGKSFPSDLKTASSARNLSKDLETFDIPSDIDDEFDSLPRTTPNSNASSCSKERRSTRPSGPSDVDYAKELAEIGSDFFSSSPEECEITRQRLVAPQTNLRQTTLFGERVAGAQVAASQVNMVRQYRQDIPPEPPSHHKMDLEAMKTWVYPKNLGQIRDYQYSIVKTGLFSNTLVALPTGLGKTFIAATIMLNYYRWFPDAQIVFMAPTKPLVSQQVDACFNVAGIPRSVTTMLNGEVKIDLREEEWANKRVFFMTPQTLEKDISSGRADPKRIVLMVIDEAHKATGKFAYVKCIEKVRAFSKSFRVLALTATPGSTVEKVQEVVDSLEIAKVEIRTEASIDIQPFVYHRNVDEIILQPSDEMNEITSLFSKVLQPLVNILCSQKAFYNSDPMSLTSFGVVQSVREWVASPAGRGAGEGLKNQMRSVSAILASIAHSIKLLKFHGMSPFYANLKAFRDGVEEKGEKGSKYKKQIVNSGDFKEMMNHLQSWTATDDFIGHPKITVLCDTILNHFMDAGEGTNAAESSTKVMVFSEFRDSADTLLTELLKHRPMVRPSIFVGQADSGRSAGMKQSQQGQVIKDFKTGKFNVLVATCIGEEGLDIGEIDLIICYDCSASPIRMLQRMGRTGRKRAGRIVLLMMEGKEHDNFAKAKDNYGNMQELISDGRQFAFRNDLSTRIVPRDIKPEVDKRVVDIPFENTQNPALPVPRAKGRGVAKKKTAKKFHMPDGVIIGFQKASKMVDGGDMAKPKVKRARRTQQEMKRDAELATAEKTPIPKLESVLLTSAEEKELERSFQSVGGNAWDQEVLPPDLTKYPQHQRKPRPTFRIGHSRTTKDFISTLQKMHSISQSTLDEWDRIYAAYPDVAMEANSAERDALGEETLDEGLLDNSIAVESDEHDESDGEAAHLQNVHSSGPRGSIALGSDTEGEDPDDDQDHDLPDFVVNDDLEEEKSQVSSPITISSPYIAADTTRRKPFYEVTEFPATQDTDDGLPDITALVRKRRRESPPRRTSASEVLRGRGRKRPVFDDDSDE